jgi:RimJ/RimL family protein N-acetyltransferase
MHVFLETERVLLRRFTEADADDLFALDGDPEVMRFISGGKPTPLEVIRNETLPRFLGYYERFDAFGCWAAIEKSSGDFLGWFAFCPPDDAKPDQVELGYRLRKAAWGRGYGTEVSRALVRKGFTELGARRVFATADRVNYASRRVMEKAGLTLARIFRFDDPWPHLPEGPEQDGVDYALDKADWERQQQAEQEQQRGSRERLAER